MNCEEVHIMYFLHYLILSSDNYVKKILVFPFYGWETEAHGFNCPILIISAGIDNFYQPIFLHSTLIVMMFPFHVKNNIFHKKVFYLIVREKWGRSNT